MGQTLIGSAASLVFMLGADKKTAADINRWIWAFGMQIAVGSITNNINQKLLVEGIDPNMQLFDVALWSIGGFLAWREIDRMKG